MEVDLSSILHALCQSADISYFDGLDRERLNSSKNSLTALLPRDLENFAEPQLNENTILVLEDEFGLKAAIFWLPNTAHAVMAGPWIDKEWTIDLTSRVHTLRGQEAAKHIQDYVVGHKPPAALFMRALQSILQSCWGHALMLKDVELIPNSLKTTLVEDEFFNRSEVSKQYMEEKNRLEKELLDQVRYGNAQEAWKLYEQQAEMDMKAVFSKGPAALMRKNLHRYNVLFSSAVSNANVHPAYIYKLYSYMYDTIETGLSNPNFGHQMAQMMIREYCGLVNSQSLKSYPPLIQNAINFINLNIDTPLSLNVVAAKCHVSPSYLSSLFKKSTGQTLTDYIASRRIDMAKSMLERTDRSVTEIASKVGFTDINYFTRIFKKQTGITPTGWRDSKRTRSA